MNQEIDFETNILRQKIYAVHLWSAGLFSFIVFNFAATLKRSTPREKRDKSKDSGCDSETNYLTSEAKISDIIWL